MSSNNNNKTTRPTIQAIKPLISDVGSIMDPKTGKHDKKGLSVEKRKLTLKINKLKEQVKGQMSGEELEYRLERQIKLRLSKPTPTPDNPFPEYRREDYDRIVTTIRSVKAKTVLIENTTNNGNDSTNIINQQTVKYKDCSD